MSMDLYNFSTHSFGAVQERMHFREHFETLAEPRHRPSLQSEVEVEKRSDDRHLPSRQAGGLLRSDSRGTRRGYRWKGESRL